MLQVWWIPECSATHRHHGVVGLVMGVVRVPCMGHASLSYAWVCDSRVCFIIIIIIVVVVV